ncbi:hypothetical protein NDU88_006757 [Pleurodeles waltl]|uniref:Secreted protein n=1 Tax=Pleurodeles waltl TaxID=8319 RepID=A0AAV7VQL7_PLEWA|nr:hypothetical protein NDU88_006757 [Pleurodeles waltl]
MTAAASVLCCTFSESRRQKKNILTFRALYLLSYPVISFWLKVNELCGISKSKASCIGGHVAAGCHGSCPCGATEQKVKSSQRSFSPASTGRRRRKQEGQDGTRTVSGC